MAQNTNLFNRQNQTYFILRWVLIAGYAALITVVQARNAGDLTAMQDILIASGISIGLTLIVGAMMLFEASRPHILYAAVPGDWIIAGLFATIAGNNPLLLITIASGLMISGLMRFGAVVGAVQAIGVLIAVIVGLGLNPAIGFNRLTADLNNYLPTLGIIALIGIVAGMWADSLDETSSKIARQIKRDMQENTKRVEDMQERVKAIAEMTTRLNSSLDYNSVIDAALDIGRLSLRPDAHKRTVSMVLMVEDDETLEIASSRGLNHVDQSRTLEGKAGILLKAFEKGTPIINGATDRDPELSRLLAFKSIQSVLVIPLRAMADTYGLLVYGSSDANAFNADTIDTLQTIAVQATIALQNATLYTTLREEKERIIQIEENARKALVRDLHDVPTQTISAVAMRLGSVPMLLKRDPKQVPEEIETIRQMTLRATEEIRHVLFSLRPLSLEARGLKVALEQLSDKMQKTFKQRVSLQLNADALASLEPKHEGSLFYLVEEAVNNARKYAKASEITVRVDLEGRQAVVRVIDNGAGFDMSSVNDGYEQRGSFGMVNMHERAEIIGGTFKLQSEPGKGTMVTVRVPVTPRKAQGDNERAESQTRTKLQAPQKKVYTGPLSPSR